VAQEDYAIADQAGTPFLTDLNNHLLAIVSNNSGATAPSTTFAYQWWADTTTGLLKIRNAANSAWVTVGTLASANLGLATLASPTLTGTPAAPTASVNTNTTQLATTAFVLAQAASAAPLIDASSAAVGTATKFAREDHVHPASAIGVGQTYQNLTASRAIGGGPYTNSTGRTIAISVSCLINAADAYLNVTVNGSVVGFSTQTYASGKAATLPFFIIPPGATYSVSTSTGTASSLTWNELR
jgi:hypothetical protein